MASEHTIIDVTKSLVPLNQEAIAESITYSDRGRSQPIPYAGKNILPTPLGYQSFFGTEVLLGSELLASLHVQDIISYRLLPGNTILLALCAEGCYFSTLSNTGTPTITNLGGSPETLQVDLSNNKDAKWTFLFNSPQGSTSPWQLWTWAILGNDLYIYQKGMKFIARIKANRYGQFLIEKLLPSFIISAVAKIYKYRAYLEIKSTSSFTSRSVTSFGVPVTVLTDTLERTSKAHGELVSLMNSAGMGAILSKQASSTDLTFFLFTLKNDIPHTFDTLFSWKLITISGTITSWVANLQLDFRGTILSIPPIALTNSFAIAKYIADTINASAIPGVTALPFGSKTSLDSLAVHIYEERISGNSTFSIVNPSVFTPNIAYISDLPNTCYKYDKSKYRIPLQLYLEYISDPYPPGTTITYSDVNISISYTTTASESGDYVQEQLFRKFEAAGYVVDRYYWLVMLPDNMYFDTIGRTYPNITSSSNYSFFITGNYSGALKEVTPSAEIISIESTGVINKLKELNSYIGTLPQPDGAIRGIKYQNLVIPSTGGTLVIEPRKGTLNHAEAYEGGESYSHIIPAWTTLLEANSALIDLITFINTEVIGFSAYVVTTPTPDFPTNSIVIRLHTWDSGRPLWASRYTITLNGAILINNSSGTFNGNTAFGALETYSCTFVFRESHAIAYGTAMSIVVDGILQSWNWTIGSANLTTILNAIALLPNYSSISYSNESGGAVTITANFSPINNSESLIVLANNGEVFSGTITNSNVSLLDITDTLYYSPLVEHQYFYIPVGQPAHTLTLTKGGISKYVYIYPTDSALEIESKILEALDFLVTSTGYHYGRPTIYEAKYIGTIDFSVLSLTGTDPLVSVGASAADELFTLTSISNDVIELAQVEGICTARNRLMAWDYLNTIYLGSASNPIDFTPSITTQANSFKVEASKGNITLMLPTNDGVIIYSTDNVVKGTYQPGAQQLYSFKAITDQGTIDPRHITRGRDLHFFLNSDGVYTLNPSSSELNAVTKELADFLRSYKYPTKIQILGDRYLVINLLEHPLVINGQSIRNGFVSSYEQGLSSSGLTRPIALLSNISDVPLGQNLFPTFKHCLVLDLLLEKWGYGTLDNLAIFSLSPINQGGYSPEKDYALSEAAYFNDSRSLGAMLPNGQAVLLNDNPSDAYILYGKHKLSSSRFTKVLEVEAQFVDYPEAYLQLEPSDEEGRVIDFAQVKTSPTFTKASYRWPLITVARWFNILVRGRFNLSFLSIEGIPDGKRK